MSFQVDFLNPCIVVKSFGNRPILHFGGLEDLWGNIFESFPVQSGGACQNEVLCPLPIVIVVAA
jgi:hypothetical protein